MKEINKNLADEKIPKLVWGWILISILLTLHTLNSLYLPPIPLFDNSCSSPTIMECSEKSKSNAKEAIRQRLPSVLEKMMGNREAFSLLKLTPSNYTLFIVDKGSESEWRISYPPQVFPSGKVDLLCDISSEQVRLRNMGQIELATIIYTTDIQKGVSDTVQLIDEFKGCTFYPLKERYGFNFPKNTVVGPNETVSWNILMKPYLKFEISLGTVILIFTGWFALIGALFALIKQFLSVARNGMRYFSSDEEL